MIVGLIRGRHRLPPEVTEYIWECDIADVTDVHRMDSRVAAWLDKHNPDSLTVYVTGLTAALVSVINACHTRKIPLYLMHYNRETRSYFPQPVL